MLIGTDVLLKSEIEVADGSNPDSVTIDIYDPKGTNIINDANTTDEGNGIFSYIFQSSEDGLIGWYSVVFKAVKGIYKGQADIEFELKRRKKHY